MSTTVPYEKPDDSVLDDAKHISQIDKSNMLDTLAHFPEQVREAADLMKTIHIPDFIKIDNVIIIGMGASGISGDFVQHLFRDTIDIPVFVNKEPDLPKWVNKHTLAIFLSYSGNTEETLNSFKIASQKKCKIIGVSSGGKLQELCEKRGIVHIGIPAGFQPRVAIAYLFTPLLFILESNHLIKNVINSDLEEAYTITNQLRNQCISTVGIHENPAKQIAQKLFDTTPQLYGWGIYTPIARRWRSQINENSKMIAREDIVSECNHNDIVGWSADVATAKKWSCILFRDKDEESLYLTSRLDFMKTLFEGTVAQVIEVFPKGKSRLTKLLYMLSLGDFVSYYLAILRNIDPTPIDAITALKNRLNEL